MGNKLREDEAVQKLRHVFDHGRMTVDVSSKERQKTLKHLLMVGDSTSISGDVFQAISEFVNRRTEELQKQKERSDEAIVEKAEEIRKKRERGTDKEYLQKLRDEKNG